MGVIRKKSTYKTAFVLMAAAVVAMLLSVHILCVEPHHQCHGEDCPICACIEQCHEILRQLSGAIPAAVTSLIPVAVAACAGKCLKIRSVKNTPVDLRVRLND